jgi:hypothetical protein
MHEVQTHDHTQLKFLPSIYTYLSLTY